MDERTNETTDDKVNPDVLWLGSNKLSIGGRTWAERTNEQICKNA